MAEIVTMQSPDGEIREVNANGPDLVPLMVQGWFQRQPSTKADGPAVKPEPKQASEGKK